MNSAKWFLGFPVPRRMHVRYLKCDSQGMKMTWFFLQAFQRTTNKPGGKAFPAAVWHLTFQSGPARPSRALNLTN